VNIKLREAAKQFKISNKIALYFLEINNLPVKSHASAINYDQLELLREFSGDEARKKKVAKDFEKFEKDKKLKPKEAVKKTIIEEKKPEPEKVEDTPTKTEPLREEKIEIKEEKIVEKRIEYVKETEIKRSVEKPVEKITTPVVSNKNDIPVKKVPEVKAPIRQAPVNTTVIKPKVPVQPIKPKAPIKKPVLPQSKYSVPAKKMSDNRRGFRYYTKKRGPKVPRMVSTIKRKEMDLDLPEIIQVSDFITVKELSEKLNIKLKDFQIKMEELGKNLIPSQILSSEELEEICNHFEVAYEIIEYEDLIISEYIAGKQAKKVKKAPVVTVMGHVDHGKTTLLDNLRKTRVAEREAGGITQSIGAYKLRVKDGDIVFIDTPGHEAFTNLRARGAKITDIVVLVVAANDGVKPQTIEAINHALSAKVPIIVAINKIDLDSADPNKVKQELSRHNIIVEDWGGDIVSVEISAKQGTNMDTLLEMISITAEMQELTAYNNIPAYGTILESKLDTKLGALGTVLIQGGMVKRGDFFICGNSVGKIKSLIDDTGKTVQSADVPYPVEIMGFSEVPTSGQRFLVVEDIDKVKKIVDLRKLKEKDKKQENVLEEKKMSLKNLFSQPDGISSNVTNFPIIIKTDNFGSGEVLEEILMKKNSDILKINIIHKGIGNITEGDILLASTANAIIFGFNVKAPNKVLGLAKNELIEIKLYNVIYHLIEDVDKAIKGEIEPEFIENYIGKLEVLQKFKISKIGTIAGCIVKEGKITKKSKLKVMRGNDLVFEGELETLRRVKDEVASVNAGTECGVKIKNFNAIDIGDILETYELVQK
jgi:translation initiation factor IF-2